MKVFQMRDYTRDELLQKKHDLEEELFNLKLRKMTKQLENPLKLRNLRKEIARINTVLTEDEKGLRRLASEAELKLSGTKTKKE